MITLDDPEKAYEFKVKTLARAEQLIGDILSVTTGNTVVTEDNDEWGHGLFLELFEILSIRHKNFSVPDFIKDLSDYLFTWTLMRDKCVRDWKKQTLAKRGLGEYGIELENSQSSDAPEVEVPKA